MATDLAVGQILGAWGVQGWLRLRPFSQSADGLLKVRDWRLNPAPPGMTGPMRVRAVRRQGEYVLAQLQGVTDRDAAESLRGADVWVPRDALPATARNEFYWVDLIGCHVVNLQDTPLGAVDGLIETGPQAVLRVTQSQGDGTNRLRMIPFVDRYVPHVDVAARRVVVDWDPAWDD